MPDNVKPSLSPDGWIGSPVEKLDDLLADFYYSEYSQSTIYLGNVASMPWIIQEKRGRPADTADLVRTTLTRYLERYFMQALVTATWADDPTDASKASITLGITVADASGQTYSVYDVVNLLDSKFMGFIRANNGE